MDPVFVIAFYFLLGVGTLVVAVLLYLRAGLSRSTYYCPKCRTSIRVELMQASHCSVCGSPLRSTQEDDPYESST